MTDHDDPGRIEEPRRLLEQRPRLRRFRGLRGPCLSDQRLKLFGLSLRQRRAAQAERDHNRTPQRKT